MRTSSPAIRVDHSYDAAALQDMQSRFGPDFLSPGGPGELAHLVRMTDIRSKRGLDIGCGLGGYDRLLVSAHAAGHVTGVDVNADVIARARASAADAGLSERLDFLLWKADRPERTYAMKAQSQLMDMARDDPTPLVERMQQGEAGADVLAVVLGVTGTRSRQNLN